MAETIALQILEKRTGEPYADRQDTKDIHAGHIHFTS